MLRVDEKGNIYLNRADTGEITLTIKDSEGDTYDYSGDTVVFGVKRSALDKTAPLIEKTFDENGKISFSEDDTKDMEYGNYIYSIRATHEETVEEETVTTSQTVLLANFTVEWAVV